MSGPTAAAALTPAMRLAQLRELLHRNASTLGLDRATLRVPRPGALSVRTSDGALVTIEFHVYETGQW